MKTALRLTMMALSLPILPLSMQAQDFTCASNGDNISITGYTGPGGAVTIPETINGLPVASIGEYAFSGCSSVTSVSIPASVTGISGYAFSGSMSLEAINVDTNNLTYSSVDGVLYNNGQTALLRCPEGRTGDCVIPHGVTTIDFFAFSDCTRLTSVTIPASVTSIGFGAFSGCTRLTAINADTNHPIYSSVDGVLFSKGQSSIVLYPQGRTGDYSIPYGVTSISPIAFSGCNGLTGVTIPNSVTNIGDFAFVSCRSLANVTIPNSVTRVGDWAFNYCTRLRGIYFQGNAPSYGRYAFGEVGNAILYYLPGTTGWGPVIAARPAVLWLNPVILDGSVALQANGIGFRVSWAPNTLVVVEAATDLSSPVWSPVITNTLPNGWSDFRDPEWVKYSSRFYRVRPQ